MNCPVCKTSRLESSDLESGKLRASVCGACGGHWINSFQYWKWREQQPQTTEAEPSTNMAPLPVADSKPGKLCPECGGFLMAHPVGHGVPFRLDRCGRCGGIWFDGNEWETLRRAGLHDDVHYIFSEAWQSQVKRAERTSEYRKVVLAKQEALLGESCSEADVVEARRIKAWLDSHPHSPKLYAYLLNTRDL